MRRFTVVLLLLVIALPAFSLAYSPRAEVRIDAEFYHSNLVSETIPYRTSFNVNGDVVPLYFDFDKAGFGAGLSISYTTRSLAFGYSIIKPYRAFGGMIGLDWHVSRIFSLCFKSRLMVCAIGPVYVDKFASIELELEPSIRVVQKKHMKVNVLVPVTAVLRKDGYCFRVGAGLGVSL